MAQVPTVIVVLGAILFLLGILGGGISLKEISLPPVSTKLRLVLVPMSLAMMAFGVWLSLGGTFALPSPDASRPPSQELQETGGDSSTTPLAPPAVVAPSPTTSVGAATVPHYEQEGALIYEEDFEDGVANGWDGSMEIVQLGDGNHVWRPENDQERYTLPGGVFDYAVEARIMKEDGPDGAAGIGVRAVPGEACGHYFTYMRSPWLALVEVDASCEEVRDSYGAALGGYQISFSQEVWYTLALEANGSTMSVYLDGELIGSGVDDTHRSNIAFLWSCCGDWGPHSFYFDDVRIFSLQ